MDDFFTSVLAGQDFTSIAPEPKARGDFFSSLLGGGGGPEEYAEDAARGGHDIRAVGAGLKKHYGVELDDNLRQSYKLGQYRERFGRQTEGVGEIVLRNAIPFASAGVQLGEGQRYQESLARRQSGQATDQDLIEIAANETRKEQQRAESTSKAIARAAAGIPAVVGELGLGGKIVGAGAKALAARGVSPAAATAVAEGTGLGASAARGALSTPITPSAYLPHAQAGAERTGTSALSPENLAPAMALGAIQNAVLGQLQGKVAGPNLAARVASKAAVGLGEQQAADVGVSALDDAARQITGQTLGLSTRYGTIGSFVRGDDDAWKRLAAQAATFALFAGMHSGKGEQQSAPDKVTEALGGAIDGMAKKGANRSMAAQRINDLHQRFAGSFEVGPESAEGKKAGTEFDAWKDSLPKSDPIKPYAEALSGVAERAKENPIEQPKPVGGLHPDVADFLQKPEFKDYAKPGVPQKTGSGEPPIPEGHARYYHGGANRGTKGPLWFARDRDYAEGYAAKTTGGEVSYVDVPLNHDTLAPGTIENIISVGRVQPLHTIELPGELASGRKYLPSADKTPVKFTGGERQNDAKSWLQSLPDDAVLEISNYHRRKGMKETADPALARKRLAAMRPAEVETAAKFAADLGLEQNAVQPEVRPEGPAPLRQEVPAVDAPPREDGGSRDAGEVPPPEPPRPVEPVRDVPRGPGREPVPPVAAREAPIPAAPRRPASSAAQALIERQRALQAGKQTAAKPPIDTTLAKTIDEVTPEADLPEPTEPAPRLSIDNYEVAKLSPRERELVERRVAGETLESIGRSKGFTRQRAHQIEQAALGKMGHAKSVADEVFAAERAEREADMIQRGKAVRLSEMRADPREVAPVLKRRESELSKLTDLGEELNNKFLEEIDRAERNGQPTGPVVERYKAALAAGGVGAARPRPGRTPEAGTTGQTRAAPEAGSQKPDAEGLNPLAAQVAEHRTTPFGEAFPRPRPQETAVRGGIPGNPGGSLAPAGFGRQFALAKEQVKGEREERGRDAIAQAARRSNQEAWDEAVATLQRNPNAGAELVDRLEADPRLNSDADVPLLLQRRVALSNEFDAASDALGAGELQKLPETQLEQLRRRVEDVAAQRDRLDDVTAKVGTRLGRGLQFFRQLAAEDYTLSGMLARASAAKGKPLTKEESTEIAALAAEIKQADEKADKVKSGKAKAAKPGEEGDEADVRIATQTPRKQFRRRLTELKQQSLPFHRRAAAHTREGINASRALVTAIDLSGVLRQGGIATISRPVMASRAIPGMLKSFRSERAYDRVMDEIGQRPNADAYKESGLYLSDATGLNGGEEAFLGRWVGKIPGIAGSSRAYAAYLNRVRADLFDSMSSTLTKTGKPTPAEAEAISNYVNVATGRGKVYGFEKSADALGLIFFSPRYVASRFEYLAGQPLYAGSARTRKLVAQEYARYAAGLATITALGAAAAGASVSGDPREADFGKIRKGDTRIDHLSGLSQNAVFASRAASFMAKTLGIKTGESGPQEPDKVLMNYGRSKLAPVPGSVVDTLVGKNVVGEKVKLLPKNLDEALSGKSIATGLLFPISVREVYESMRDQGVARGTALGMLSLLGAGVQNYKK
jgi:hypothetical protein